MCPACRHRPITWPSFLIACWHSLCLVLVDRSLNCGFAHLFRLSSMLASLPLVGRPCRGCRTAEAARGCQFDMCPRCCLQAQVAQETRCPVHRTASADGTESSVVDQIDGARRVVTFPAGVKVLDPMNPHLAFCPRSFLKYHLDTDRGLELLAAKIDRAESTASRAARFVPRTGGAETEGKKQGKGKGAKTPRRGGGGGGGFAAAGIDFRDVRECRSLVTYIQRILSRSTVATEDTVEMIEPMLTRMFEILVLKKEGGLKLLKSFEEARAIETLPSHLRHFTATARKLSCSPSSGDGGGGRKRARTRRAKGPRYGDADHPDADPAAESGSDDGDAGLDQTGESSDDSADSDDKDAGGVPAAAAGGNVAAVAPMTAASPPVVVPGGRSGKGGRSRKVGNSGTGSSAPRPSPPKSKKQKVTK